MIVSIAQRGSTIFVDLCRSIQPTHPIKRRPINEFMAKQDFEYRDTLS